MISVLLFVVLDEEFELVKVMFDMEDVCFVLEFVGCMIVIFVIMFECLCVLIEGEEGVVIYVFLVSVMGFVLCCGWSVFDIFMIEWILFDGIGIICKRFFG